MAKTHFKEVSASKFTVENQPGQAAQASSLGAVTISTLTLGSGNAIQASAATTTHKMAVSINGTTYYVLLSNI